MMQKQCNETVYYEQANDLGCCKAEGHSLRDEVETRERTSRVDIKVGSASRAWDDVDTLPSILPTLIPNNSPTCWALRIISRLE